MASNPKRIDKVFIDSSVLIAAAISPGGSARELIKKALCNKIQVVISDLVIEETQRNLTNKAPKALVVLQFFLEILNPEVVRPTESLVKNVSKTIELKDAPIVAGAVATRADYLASFDRKRLLQHKQEIEKNFKVKVVTPDLLTK